jgi:excisionase family DNA binding protein
MANKTSDKTQRATSSQSEVAQLLNTEQAAACLGISKRTIQELTASRKLAFIKFGRNVRFDPADLAAFADKNRVKAIGWKGGQSA